MLSVIQEIDQENIVASFSGEIPEDLEGILERSRLLLEEVYPNFVNIAKLTWQTFHNNFNVDPQVIPVKVVIKGNPSNIFEPGVIVGDRVLVPRGSTGEAQSFINDMVEDDTFYCEVPN